MTKDIPLRKRHRKQEEYHEKGTGSISLWSGARNTFISAERRLSPSGRIFRDLGKIFPVKTDFFFLVGEILFPR